MIYTRCGGMVVPGESGVEVRREVTLLVYWWVRAFFGINALGGLNSSF